MAREPSLRGARRSATATRLRPLTAFRPAHNRSVTLFFMNDDVLAYLDKSDGREIGVGPSIVIADEGMARALTTTAAKDDVYAFFFSQHGLMLGLGLQGSKFSKINK